MPNINSPPVKHAQPHDCRVSQLRFVAHYGAPGTGQEWRCSVCGREWARVGNGTFHDPAECAHSLEPEDQR